MQSIDELLALSTSPARAGLIAALFGDDPRPRHQSLLARELGVPLRSVQRELERLVRAGVVRRGRASGVTLRGVRSEAYMRPYLAEPSCPIYPELRRIAMKVRGAAATIRSALPVEARLAWITGEYAVGRAAPRGPIHVVAIGRPKRLVGRALERLTSTLGRPVRATVVYPDEWAARVAKREVVARRLRSGPKLWIRGSGASLRDLERDVRSAQETLRLALAGDDLTDDWDDDMELDDAAAGAL